MKATLTFNLPDDAVEYEYTLNAARYKDALAIARYISFREKNGYSKEELAELKSEFGNDEVVDVLTGKAII